MIHLEGYGASKYNIMSKDIVARQRHTTRSPNWHDTSKNMKKYNAQNLPENLLQGRLDYKTKHMSFTNHAELQQQYIDKVSESWIRTTTFHGNVCRSTLQERLPVDTLFARTGQGVHVVSETPARSHRNETDDNVTLDVNPLIVLTRRPRVLRPLGLLLGHLLTLDCCCVPHKHTQGLGN